MRCRQQLLSVRCLLATFLHIFFVFRCVAQDTSPLFQSCTFRQDGRITQVRMSYGEENSCLPSQAETEQVLAAEIETLQINDSLELLNDEIEFLSNEHETLRQDRDDLLDRMHRIRKNETECPFGFQFNHTYGYFTSCYCVASRYLTWYDSAIYCQSTGGHLVAVDSDEESDFLIEKMKQRNDTGNFWMGATDIAEEGKWVWVGTNEKIKLKNFDIDNLDNKYEGEHCLLLENTGLNFLPNDVNCEHKQTSFICEYILPELDINRLEA